MIDALKPREPLATFNFVLFFIGFDFVTSFFSLFIPNIAEYSQIITVPYRAFALVISFIVLFKYFNEKVEFTKGSIFLILYLFLLSIRFFFDFGIRTDVVVDEQSKIQYTLLFIQMLVLSLSIVKSYKRINLTVTFKWIYFFYSFIILVNYFSIKDIAAADVNQQISTGVRNTIATGYVAANYLLLSVYFLRIKNSSRILKLLCIPIMLCAFIILLHAGSKGPLLSVIIAALTFFVMQNRNFIAMGLISIMVVTGFYFFFEDIIGLIFLFAPIMAYRIQVSVEQGDSARLELFSEGMNEFLNNPLFGSQAFLYRPDGLLTYPHQLIIEALMSTGIFGGLLLLFTYIILVKNNISNLYKNISNYWLELILFTYLIRGLTAGSIYGSEYPIIFLYFLLATNRPFLKRT